jgi:hypothetical protein
VLSYNGVDDWNRFKPQSSEGSCPWDSVPISCKSDFSAIEGPEVELFFKRKLSLI